MNIRCNLRGPPNPVKSEMAGVILRFSSARDSRRGGDFVGNDDVSSSHRIRCRVTFFRKENANNKLATEEKRTGIGDRSVRVRVVKLWNVPQIA
jgi:hypothetical protein